MILLLDHDDSFVHTLAGYVERTGRRALVVRDSEIDLGGIRELNPEGIILSPGPCTPEECPVARSAVLELGPTVPILGVCLGHQVIAAALGGAVARSAHPRHGMTSPIGHDGTGIFAGVPSPMMATRYHSLAVVEQTLPPELQVSARSDDGEVMAIRHTAWPMNGVQFHPESVLTDSGDRLIRNWLVEVRSEK